VKRCQLQRLDLLWPASAGTQQPKPMRLQHSECNAKIGFDRCRRAVRRHCGPSADKLQLSNPCSCCTLQCTAHVLHTEDLFSLGWRQALGVQFSAWHSAVLLVPSHVVDRAVQRAAHAPRLRQRGQHYRHCLRHRKKGMIVGQGRRYALTMPELALTAAKTSDNKCCMPVMNRRQVGAGTASALLHCFASKQALGLKHAGAMDALHTGRC